MKRILLLAALFVSFAVSSTYAQKIGYVNSQALLQELPDFKNAEANFENFRNQLQKKLEQKAQLLQSDFQAVQRKAEQGELSPIQQEQESTRLREEQSQLVTYEQDIQKQLVDRQTTELQPIYDSVNDAIKSVAEENGFTYIIDASSGVILYADETSDVTALVKAKLGM